MKRKASSLLLVAVFLLALFCPHVLWGTLGSRLGGESEEKRTLAQKPVFSLEEIDGYPKAYEAYYNDHLPFRNLLIKLYNNMQYHVFGTSSSEDVILGKDGWMFYSSRIDGTSVQCYDGSLLFTDEELEAIAKNMTDAKARLAEQGTDFIVYIAPNKERVYSEYMPDYMGEPAQECMVNQIVDYLREHTDIRVVYPYEAMMAYKEAHPEQLLYYQADTHWNELGAYIGARELLTELGIETPAPEELRTTVFEREAGDLLSLLNLWGVSDKGYVKIEQTDSAQQPKTLANEFNGRMEFEMPGTSEIRIFMHKDSFGSGMAPHLKNHFSRALLVHNTNYDSQEVWTEKPDVFVLEVVERYIGRLRNPVL